jgi:hypothetical protein
VAQGRSARFQTCRVAAVPSLQIISLIFPLIAKNNLGSDIFSAKTINE